MTTNLAEHLERVAALLRRREALERQFDSVASELGHVERQLAELRVDDHAALAEPDPDPEDEPWEAVFKHQLARRALQIMHTDFQPSTWRACYEVVVVGRPVAEVAAELGLTPGAVHAARFRVLARLRQELKGMLD